MAGAPRTPRLVGDVLRDAARAHPDREAYVDGEHRLTYGDLDRAADGVATTLRDLGAAPGTVVVLALSTSADFAACYLGAARAGTITSAINLRLGPREQASIVERSAPVVTIADDDVEVPPGAGRVLRRRDLADVFDTAARGDPAARVAPDDPVAIVWTSGTTGLPKGAVYDHECLAEISRGMGELTAPGDRRLSVLPFPHVGYMTRVWDDFANGVTTVLAGEPWRAERTLALIESEAITMATGVPTQWSRLLAHPAAPGTDFSTLRIVGIGAAPVAPELVRRMRTTLGCPVLVRYTSTEAGITTGTRADDPDEVVAHTVGRPSPVVDLRVVDDDDHPVEPGVVGEIRCRSRAMFRGYWRDPQRSAAAHDADGYLRTGDLGFVDSDGNLHIVGRLGDRYIRGGYNVYPAEVEAVLAEHPSVARVAVVGVRDPDLGEIGGAFVVPAPGSVPVLDDLRAWCRERIAHYKAPDRLVVVDDLPETSMHKIDKVRLRARAHEEAP